MTAYLAPQFDTQFFDGSTVAAGYKLYTYDSGTTTPKATYSDQAGVTPQTNPIILDAAGRVPGELFLGPGEYTLTLKTAADSLVKTWDNVAGADTLLRSDLASTSDASKGAGMVGSNDGEGGSLWTTVAGFIAFLLSSLGSSVIGFIQSGIGAIRRSMQDKGRELVSVKDFGAVGDGVADDTDAIRRAIAAVAAVGGGEVRFPNGRYRITDTIRVPSFVVLRGISVGGFPYYGPTGKSSVIVVDFGASVYKWAIEPDTRYITGDGTIPYNTLLQGEDLGSVWRGVYGAGVVGLHITTKNQTQTNIVYGALRFHGAPHSVCQDCTVVGDFGTAYLLNASFGHKQLNFHSESQFYGTVMWNDCNAVELDGYCNKSISPTSLAVPADYRYPLATPENMVSSLKIDGSHSTSAKGLLVYGSNNVGGQFTGEYWPDVVYAQDSYGVNLSRLYTEGNQVAYCLTATYASVSVETLHAYCANAELFDFGFACRADVRANSAILYSQFGNGPSSDPSPINNSAVTIRGIPASVSRWGLVFADDRKQYPVAWVRFAGPTGAIQSSYNVSSVTRNGAGDYQINLTNPIYTALLCPVISTSDNAYGSKYAVQAPVGDVQTRADYVKISTFRGDTTAQQDPQAVFVVVFA